MKSEPKAFASLSSGLLARKGAARPAMRPQGFGQIGAGLEDLGWNDMGFEPPKPVTPIRDSEHDAFGEELEGGEAPRHPTGLSPVDSPVHSQQAEIAGRFAPESDEDCTGDDEIDETAELYEPETDGPAKPMAVDTKAPIVLSTPEPDMEVEAEQAEVEIPTVPVAEAPRIVAIPSAPRIREPKARAAPGSKSKAAFTLRLDPERHLKLRLACAVRGQSAQLLVTDALDALLAQLPELEAMAAKAKRKE